MRKYRIDVFNLTAFFLGLALVVVPVSFIKADTGTLSAPTTVEFQLEKKFSGPVPEGYTADQFSFVIGGHGTVSLTAFTDDSANGSIELPVGTYSLEEIGPSSFVATDWTIQWSGVGCDSLTGESTTITVNEDDLGKENFGCRADNQYKPENNPDNGGGGDNGGDESATLTVVKVITGTSTSPSEFSFLVNNSDQTNFEADGTNELTLDPGTYSILESTTTGYTVSYSNCTGLTLEDGDSETCTITNTYTADDDNDGGDNDGGGSDEDRYRIEGYVWHDSDQNGEWDKSNEEDLHDWTVMITNGTTTETTTTDETGYYFFDVVAGTWTVSEVLKDNWSQSHPNNNSYTITVPMEQSQGVTLMFPLNLFFKVAEAAVIETYSGYNFGNYQTSDGNSNDGGGSDGNDDDDDGSGSVAGGCYNCGVGGGYTPKVLGEQVSVIPNGAPNTGFGGAAPSFPLNLPIVWEFLHWLGLAN